MKFSRFARHYQQATGTVQLMADLGRARSAPPPVYMLGGGNPAHIPAAEALFQQAMSDLADDTERLNQVLGEYDAPEGSRGLASLLADLLRARFGWKVTADNIAITNGSQSSFGLLFNAFAGEFDDGSFRKVLLPITPEYVGYSDVGLAETPIFEGQRPTIELLPERQFKYHVDRDALVIDERYGVVCVSRPTNPTGNVITDTELQRLADQAQAADVPLIIDGAYGVPFPGMTFVDATPMWNDNIILCLSLSKLGLPGVRTGLIVANETVIDLVRNANAINGLAPGRVGPEIAAMLLQQNQLESLCTDVIRPYYLQKVQHALQVIAQHMGDLPVRVHKPEGALFLWLWFEDLPISNQQLYEQLVTQGVYIIPGHHFYPGLEDAWPHCHQCIRVNYAAADHSVEQGLRIIAETVRKLYC